MPIFFSKAMRGLTADDRAILREAGVRSERQLAKRVESEPRFVETLALPGPAARLRVLKAAGEALQRRSLRIRVGLYPRLWPTVAVILIIGVSVAAVWRDLLYTFTPPSIIRVARANGIEPFHLIGRSDLKPELTPPDSTTVNSMERAIGRYLKEYASPNSVFDPKKLNEGRPLSTELADRSIIRLKVVSTSLFEKMPPPFSAGLMASPHDRGAGALLLNDVLVLDLQKDSEGMTAVLAIPTRDESSFAAFAARSDFYLIVTRR